MTISNTKLLLVAILFAAMAKPANAQTPSKPNVIFILEDDAGYETITANGGQSYSTPNIDYLAQNGMRFTHCEATPVCSPSRTMLLTGKYNFRNYSIWGYMNHGEKTIGNLMKDAGYETAWFGKLQLYGHDSDILNMGFNQYLVFEMLSGPTYSNLYRYKSPVLYSNGEVRMPDSLTVNKYGDDILTQQLCDFIDSNQHRPFFAYYPMSLCHNPDSPTPDDSAFASYNPRIYKDDSSYFPSHGKIYG